MPATQSSCSGCREPVGAGDRFCRHCGNALAGAPNYTLDLHRTIVETIPVGIFALDTSGRVLYWNRAMEEHGSLKRRDALGRCLFELLPHLQPYNHRIIQLFDSGVALKLDSVTHAGAHGMELSETFWFGPVLLESGSAALLGVMEDITHRMRVDTQLIRSERLAAIGELAAGVAHNFNNIMAAIGGDAQLLKLIAEEEQLPPHVVEAAQQIYEETMRGGRIAHDLLSFARGAEPQIQRLDPKEVIQDAVRLLKNHPASRAVTIEVGVDGACPMVEADPNQLHQVFFNLVLNALQAMPHGGTLTISTALRGHERDPEVGLLDIKFHDTGTGIPREHLQRIFDPFFSRRANGTTGSGLGLPVSLAMIKSIGGDIQITSAVGIGTTVTVSLPIVERRSTPRTALRLEHQGRALIIDDDPDIRRTLTTLLSRRGFEVVTAPDGVEAIRRFEEGGPSNAFDVVLVELLLPGVGGGLVLQTIREHSPDTAVVVLSGATDPGVMRGALESGARVGFSKPPNYSELLCVIERLAEARLTEDAPHNPCQSAREP